MMKKENKSINWSLKILTILAFSLMVLPSQAAAETYGTNYTFGNFGNDYNSPSPVTPEVVANPRPYISSISPKSSNRGTSPRNIMITGNGFVPSSVARVNGLNRPTNFIDNSHLMMQALGSDMTRTDGGFYVTVLNGAPGGGFSNAEYMKLNDNVISSGVNTTIHGNPNTYQNSTNYNNYSDNTYQTQTEYVPAPEDSTQYSNLASNAIFGTNSFLPSGIVQWILLGIVVLLLVIIARKIFGASDRYHSAPLKHD